MNMKSENRAIVDAMVFDAYGTLFDVQSVTATADRLFPGRGAALFRAHSPAFAEP